MTTYTIADGATRLVLATINAESPLDAAREAHRAYLREEKRPADGYEYELHGAHWGRPANRTDGHGNAAQNYDDCLFIFAGEVTPDDAGPVDGEPVAIVRAKKPLTEW